MACGTPVIGSDVGGIKYTVVDGETGFLVSPRDPDALAERLKDLLSQPKKLESFGACALQRANQHFTWKRVSEILSELYQTVIAENQAERLVPAEIAALPALPNLQRIIRQNFREAYRTLRRAESALSLAIQKTAEIMSAAILNDNKILVCGNGGSAAEAQHFTAELVGRYKISERRGLPAQALTADVAVITAWANDFGYDQVFARQVEAFGKTGDVLLGISTSGNSKNILAAFETARQNGITTIALTGNTGGDLAALADLAMIVPSEITERIQEVHLTILHMICELIETSVIHQPMLSGDFILPVMTAVMPAQPSMVKSVSGNRDVNLMY
jgi:phosphoheptose isomerase